METRNLIVSGLVGGVAMALLSSIPVINLINCLACAGVWLSAGFAVWFYRRQYGQFVTPVQGAVIGVVSGIIGAILAAILGAVIGSAGIASLVAADPTGSLDDALGGAVGVGISSFIGLIITLFVFPIFGAIGGAGAAALFGRPGSKAV